MTAIRALSCVALVLASCETLPVVRTTLAPVNSCSNSCGPADDGGTTATRCVSGVCVNAVAPTNFSLVVQVPEGNFRASGMLFALSPSQVTYLHGHAPASCAGACLPMPARSGARGVLNVDDDTAKGLWPPVGLCPPTTPTNCVGGTTLPVVAQFEPRWLDADVNGTALPAKFRGIPIGPTEGISTPVGGAPGPGGGQAVGYEVFLQSTGVPDGLVNYRFSLLPVAPFDDAFAPFAATATVGGAAETVADLRRPLADTALLQKPDPKRQSITVTSSDGLRSLRGFRAAVVSWSGHRISNLKTLSGDQGETFQPVVPKGLGAPSEELALSLVLSPPDGGNVLPSLVVPYDPSQATTLVYPKLPAPVRVEGVVTANERGVEADLVFDIGVNDGSDVEAVDAASPFVNNLTFRAFARSDAVGAYSVTLPPGRNYAVWITPRDPRFARTFVKTTINTALPVQTGRGLAVRTRARLRGRVVTFDGRPVAGGVVVASPSADRYLDAAAKATVSGLETASLGWPRETSAILDADGRYDLGTDPGEVDLCVRPADGTRFPWMVTLKLVAFNDDIVLSEVVVPPPLVVPWRLTDDLNNPIPYATVSAYMLPRDDGKPAYDRVGTLLASRLVGRAVSDGAGRFQLYLPPQLCARESTRTGQCK